MNFKKCSVSRAAIAAAATFAMLSPASRAGDTGEVMNRSGSYATGDGATGTATSGTTLSKGSAATKGTWTNAAGKTGNWQSQRNWNKLTQSGTSSGSATRPNGATATWKGTAARTAPGVISSGGTITLANGKQLRVAATSTRTVDTSVSGDKATATATSTLPNGHTGSSTATVTQTISPPSQ